MQLRSYQEEAVRVVTREIESKDKHSFAVTLAHGTGKSMVLSSVLFDILQKGISRRVLICGPSLSIVHQLRESFNNIFVDENSHPLTALFNVYVVDSNEKVDLNDSNDTFIALSTIQRVRKTPTHLKNYDLIILFESQVSNTDLEIFKDVKAQVFYLGPYINQSTIKLTGFPVFEYGIDRAIKDGYLQPPIINQFKAFNKDTPLKEEILLVYFKRIFENLYEDSKILIVCKNQDDVKRTFKTISESELSSLFNNIVIFSKYQKDFRQQLLKFNHEIGPQLFISVRDHHQGFDFKVTDTVLLKNFSSSNEFYDAIKFSLRPVRNREPSVIWDLFDNTEFFHSLLYEINYISEQARESKNSENINEEDILYTNRKIRPNGDSVSYEDLLNRRYLIDTLQGLIEHSSENTQHKPFVFGLFGKWGTGKSTIINLLKKELEDSKKKFKFIEHNAWQNEHCLNVTASIANSITNSLYSKKNIFSRIGLAFKSQVLQKKDTITISILLFSLFTIIVLLFLDTTKVQTTNLPFVHKLIDDYKYLLSFAAFVTASTWSFFKHPFTSNIKKLAEKPKLSQYLGVSEEIKEQVNALFNASTSIRWFWQSNYQPEQYILVIDDLDRCDPNSILKSLEAVRVLSERPDIIVIICVDKNILLNSIERKYQALELKLEEKPHVTARKFLAKIFQLSYELIDDTNNSIEGFISKRIYPQPSEKAININSTKFDASDASDASLRSETEELDDELFKEEINEDVQGSTINETPPLNDDFVEPAEGEKESFIDCAKLFEISNPRTLIRLHNTITMIKGMYSNSINSKTRLRTLIFATFYYEHLCNNSEISYTNSQFLSTQKANNYLNSSSIDLSSDDFDLIFSIVARTSLPTNTVIER